MNDDYFEHHRFNDNLTLKDYVERLICLGKRSQDREFQTLLNVFHWRRDDIIKWAKDRIEADRKNNLPAQMSIGDKIEG